MRFERSGAPQPARHAVGLLTSMNGNGLFIRTPHAAARGERLAIEFELPQEATHLSVEGEVVSFNGPGAFDGRRPMGMGVRFVRVDREVRARIDDFLATTTAP